MHEFIRRLPLRRRAPLRYQEGPGVDDGSGPIAIVAPRTSEVRGARNQDLRAAATRSPIQALQDRRQDQGHRGPRE